MPTKKFTSLIIFTFVVINSCREAVNQETEIAELLQQHEASKRHHFQLDGEALVRDNMDPFVAVSNGAIDTARRQDAELMFKNYFDGATYTKYEDLQPPIVRVSEDGTMAWMITRTSVARKKIYQQKEVEETFIYAGIMTYRKTKGKWMREANVSTFK